jgi:hypothetical protein
MHAAVIGCLVVASCSQPVGAHLPVRSTSPWINELINEGVYRSRTFERLISRLEQTDVLVYIVHTPITDGGWEGHFLHRTTKIGGVRYLWIAIRPRRGHDRLIAVLAHELQHALEVAQVPEIQTGEQIRSLFEKIGYPCPGSCFETHAAVEMQQRVLAELRRRGRK